ncbi:tetratricopeptide repeat protein [Terracidiphilus gabretensis]|uniref:tetratricopeptide repeat protein n=1 Tax=Terracidiphilus gabretensis TaxID=1577687 RepID=UPI00071C165B|nr:tetratricopeptide repeat protein [Terracidiphilus gabretensis]
MYLGRVAGAVALFLAATLITHAAPGPAATNTACAGPPALAAALKAHPTTENTITQGSWFAQHEQFSCAAETFRAGIKRDAGSAQLHYLYALALVAQKQIPAAVPELQKSIQLEPNALNPHLLMASLYAGADKQVEAAEEWQKVLAIDPKNEQALDGITGMMIDHGDYADVVKLLGPNHRTEKLAIRLSQALALMNDFGHAEGVLKDGLEANPHSVQLARALSVILVHQKKPDDAIAVMLKAVQEHPSDIVAAVDLYRLYILIGHLQEAATMESRLLAARPHDRDVLYLSGIIERSAGHYEQAKKLLEESVAIDPEFFYTRYNLGAVLVILHEWQEAKVNLEKAIALGIDQSEVHYELAKALNALGEHDRAQEELAKYQKIKIDSEKHLEADVAVAQADAALDAGHLEEAVTSYRQAVHAMPDSAYYHYKLSVALHKHSDFADEKTELQEAVRLNPKLASAQGALGFLLSREGDVNGSIEHFRVAVQTTPQWTDAWINLAAELAMSAQYTEARQAIAAALQLDPKNDRARQLNDQLSHDPNAQQAHP